MKEPVGKYIIKSIHRKWMYSSLLLRLALAASSTIVSFLLITRFTVVSPWWMIVFFISILIISFISGPFLKTGEKEIVRFLNLRFSNLQESTQLLLKPSGSLNSLEKLQVLKIEKELENISLSALYRKNISGAIIITLICVIVSFLIMILPTSASKQNHSQKGPEIISENTEIHIAGIKIAEITIEPPAYTGNKSRVQKHLDVVAEQGSRIYWNIHSTLPVQHLKIIINNKDSILLHPQSADSTSWIGFITLSSPGFYQIKHEGSGSEYYKMEMIRDLPPVVTISNPDAHHTIETGRPARFLLQAELADDYGLKHASISFTVARGKGEGVRFSENNVSLPSFNSGVKKYTYKNNTDLKQFGMIPGDELYYFISATDNNNQEYRTDIYIVSMPDTAELMSMEGMTLGVNLIPEYFRSQRQIIIDTERLLREKDTISAEAFKNKSNNLGLDQKLLRLRYGKFLGEESEDEIGAEAGHDHEHDKEHHNEAPSVFGDATDLMKEYGHSHDNAEDATFFEPELKAQLKATLNEMWKSELQLRTYKPSDALPFEYKALRLLKDLQQKSRVYVAKTGFNPTPLQPEKRLTGELDKIVQPINSYSLHRTETDEDVIRKSMSIISVMKNNPLITALDKQILIKANTILLTKAALQPGIYLDAVTALKKIISGFQLNIKPTETDSDMVLTAFQKIVPPPTDLPSQNSGDHQGNLSNQYYRNLNQNRQ